MKNFSSSAYKIRASSVVEEVMVCAMNLLKNLFKQKATIRPQKIGLKAAAAKRPHFAQGCDRAEEKMRIAI